MPDETAHRYLFVGIDRASRWVYVEILGEKTAANAAAFFQRLIAQAPFTVQKVLTDNGKEFTDRFCATGERDPTGRHRFDRTCESHNIDHRLIKPRHPQTNGMVERFNGRISEVLATTRFDSAQSLADTLSRYVRLYNHQIPQRALGHLSPVQALQDWQERCPGLFKKKVYNLTGLDKALDELDRLLLGMIDAAYTRHPFYGSRRMLVYLREQGHAVNRKRVQRLMRVLGLAGMAPGPATSKPHPEHKIYPYLLRGVAVTRPNQVWSTDITYIRLAHGFAYLVAIIDWYSRRVLAWRLANTLEAGFCVDCLEDALRVHGRPAVFNTDQGSQFTSAAFTGVLLDAGIEISMDGRGRALDNIFVERLWRTVKYEDVYIKGYASLPELLLGLTEYFAIYNGERPAPIVGLPHAR
jgi:putative transposase